MNIGEQISQKGKSKGGYRLLLQILLFKLEIVLMEGMRKGAKYFKRKCKPIKMVLSKLKKLFRWKKEELNEMRLACKSIKHHKEAYKSIEKKWKSPEKKRTAK